MNRVFNAFFNLLIPYVYAIVVAYAISSILAFFLPKHGVEYIQNDNNTLVLQKYDGFYSQSNIQTSSIVETKTEKIDLESLTKYELKAIYSTPTNGGWIIVQKKSSQESIILQQYEKLSGYTLTNLYKSHVIFEKDIKEYKLELPLDEEVQYEIESNADSMKQTIVVKDNNISVQRKYFDSYVEDIDKVWNDISIQDIRKNGIIKGFQVKQINSESLFGKIGLKQNDIIKAVNGTEIKSYADAFKVYNEFNRLDFLTLQILRNNEIMELNYEIN